MQTILNRVLLYLTILASLSIIIGCSSIDMGNLRPVNIPDSIRYGECEKDIPELKGDTSRDIVNFSIDAIDKISFCRMEKDILIRYIDGYNKAIGKAK